MYNPFKKKEVVNIDIEAKNTRLVVTGMCKDTEREKLEKDLKDKGINAVVTSNPVLGVFDV